MSDSLRARLRDATQTSHTKIEANAVLSQLMSKSLSEAAYRSILEKYYGFFKPLETALAENAVASETVSDLRLRFKTTSLRKDLLAFADSESQIESLPVFKNLPTLKTAAEILGALYVTEGSALGGLLISKHLSGFDFYTPDRGSFFLSDPKAVTERWKSFLARLESVPADQDEAVVASALRTFEALDQWMAAT